MKPCFSENCYFVMFLVNCTLLLFDQQSVKVFKQLINDRQSDIFLKNLTNRESLYNRSYDMSMRDC